MENEELLPVDDIQPVIEDDGKDRINKELDDVMENQEMIPLSQIGFLIDQATDEQLRIVLDIKRCTYDIKDTRATLIEKVRLYCTSYDDSIFYILRDTLNTNQIQNVIDLIKQ